MHRQPTIFYAFIILLLAASACNRDKEAENIFRLNMSKGVLESTDPAFAKDLFMMWSAHMLYNTLVETDEHLKLQPSLAKSWKISEDDLQYTFTIRDDVYFHDNAAFKNGKGRRMTASDIVYSFNRIIDPKVASYGAWIFNGRVRDSIPFQAFDDTTFIINLSKPFKPLPEILSMPYCSIVPKEAVEQWGKDYRAHPCGTGPFAFNMWDEGNIMILHKNTQYWEKDQDGNQLPYLDAVSITFNDSKATEFFLFLQGKLDFVNGIDGSFKDLVLTRKGELKDNFKDRINLKTKTYLNTEYLGFLTDTSNKHLKTSPIKNVLVRQAINYAIDREKIVTYFRNGVGVPALSGFIPEGMLGYDSTHSYGYSYNPKKSLELLAQAGYPKGEGLAEISVLTPDNYADIVNYVANQLQDVGIKLKVNIMQANLLRQQMSKSEATFFRAQWIADYPDAETYLAFFYGALPAPPNYTRYNNSTYNTYYDQAMVAPDSIRWNLYRKMDSLVMRDAAVVPLFYDEMLHFTSKRTKGFSSTPMNLIDLKRVQIID